MALNTALRSLASTLLDKFGGDITLRQVTTGAYNTTTGASAETTTDTAIRGLLEDVALREVNDLIQAGDKRLTVAAADVPSAPTTADRIVIGARNLQIVEVRTIEQDSEPITYELILRD